MLCRQFMGDGVLRRHEEVEVANFVLETPEGIEDLSDATRLRHLRMTQRGLSVLASVEEVWLEARELVHRARAALPLWQTERVNVRDILKLHLDEAAVHLVVGDGRILLIAKGFGFGKQTLRWVHKYLERGIHLLRG